MAWGTFTCRRHVAADDSNWAVFEERMNQLIPMALQNTDDAYDLYEEVPFNLEKEEFQQYAADKIKEDDFFSRWQASINKAVPRVARNQGYDLDNPGKKPEPPK